MPGDESVLIIDKQPGPTSFEVVKKIRWMLGGEKVGHAGSLDPFATGVLVILTGKATKLSDQFLNANKGYRGVLSLGTATDTLDRTGQVTETASVPDLNDSGVAEVLKGFEGEWMQVPPMYSAKKVCGVRLYELAREDIRVRRPPTPVNLFSVNLVGLQDQKIEFDVVCSKGTYVRSLADEIARRLGTVGHLSELRRFQSGEYTLGESVTLEEFANNIEHYMSQGRSRYEKVLRAEGRRETSVSTPYVGSLQMRVNSGNSFVNL